MKILMYADGFGVGTQTFISQDVHYLSQKHDLLFLCIIAQGVNLSTSETKVKILNFKHHYIYKKLWQYDIYLSYHNKKFKQELNQIINEFNPDVIHCQFGIESVKLIDNLENNNIPLVIQFRGYDASSMLYKSSYVSKLKQILNKKNYYSIFVANSLRENLKKHAINTEKSIILHSGIDLNKFTRKENIKNTTFTFLQISSLNEKKGHEYTLKAFAKFLALETSKNFKLIITGDGRRKDILIALAKKLSIFEYIEFIGFVSQKEAKSLLEKADVFVHHSITPSNGDEEGIPNAIIEAMAMELPIISTYHAGIPELVTDGVNGYLVREKDIDTYALRMHNILNWGKLTINRDVVANEFEIHKHIHKLELFYHSMINK